MKRASLAFAFALFSCGAWAQAGSIRGTIIDAATADVLPGATVVVNGTTKGTITDFDGYYDLGGLEAGTYAIRCSFIGSESKLIEGVVVRAGQATVLNFELGQATEQIEEVVVQARAVERTEVAVLTMQRKAATVLDGISAQQISRLGDSDAAGALRRVTGISVEGGKYVYVRGLSDRYSKTVLNGAQIPGLDPNRNTVQMDIFPSSVIENMIVHKTFSPELPGDFTGGYVNIKTKDFPERFTLQFSSTLGYNPQANLRDDFLSYQGGNTDWLGIDDGTRAIPDAARVQIPTRFVNDALLTDITRSFNTIMEPEFKSSFLDQSYSFAVGNQSRLAGRVLGYNLGISYSNSYQHFDDGRVGQYSLTAAGAQTLNSELVLDKDQQGTHDVLWSALGNVNYKLSDNHKVGFTLIRNQSGSSLARYQEGKKYSDDAGLNYQTRTLQYQQRSFTAAQLKGEHLFPNLGGLHVEWLSSAAVSEQYEPDLRFFTNDYEIIGGERLYSIQQSLYPVPTRFWREMSELNFDNKLDFTLPLDLAGRAVKLKFGGALVLKERDFDESKFFFQENSNSFAGDVADYLRPENLGSPNNIFVSNSERSNQRNSYTGQSTIWGAYLMGDLPLGRLRAVVGARVEGTYIYSENKSAVTDVNNYAEAIVDEVDLLPALNLTYSLTDRMNLRAAYTRTLARPSFRELMPLAIFEFVGGYVSTGNPNLDRTLIDNIDLRWEYYPSPGEIVSLSGFYKAFHDPIERTFNTTAANPELTWSNVGLAKVMGVELEVRKSLAFFHLLRDFKVGGNFTYVFSEVSIGQEELNAKRFFDPEHPDTRVMYGQPPYIVNTYLNYTNDSIGFEANVGFNVAGRKLFAVNALGIPDIFEQPRPQLDLTLAKSFGPNISLKFTARNLLDPATEQTYDYEGREYIFGSYTLGRSFSLGFSYLVR